MEGFFPVPRSSYVYLPAADIDGKLFPMEIVAARNRRHGSLYRIDHRNIENPPRRPST